MPTAGSDLSGADYLVLVGYFALMLGIGAYFYQYVRRVQDYFTGANQWSSWLSS
jgi:Na+/proline symporter